jgi:hypothetical protein
VTALAAQITLLQFLARPLVFSYPLFLGVLELTRARPGPRAVVGVPLLTAIWANTHPSAVLAPAVAAFFWLRSPGRNAAGLAALLGALALGATPWGYGWIVSMAAENRPYFALVEEWGSPRFGELRFLPCLLYLLLALAARRGGERLPAPVALWGAGWLAAALVSARLAPYAALAWGPFLARDLARLDLLAPVPRLATVWRAARDGLAPMERALRPRFWPLAAGILTLALAPRLALLCPGAAQGFPRDRFPHDALAAADSLGLGRRVFCNYAWGGFVAWESGARYRTFIDGRAGFFGEEGLRDYLNIVALEPGWEATLGRIDPDWILVSPDLPLVGAAPLAGGWRVAHRSPIAAILIESAEP